VTVFSFLFLRPPRTSEALKKRFKFWILDLKVCLKKLGIGSGWYGKSVLYLRMRVFDKDFLAIDCRFLFSDP
jgi:hypothetical protein